MSLNSRRELVAAIVPRYRFTNKAGKKVILDEFVQTTGLNRKHSITILRKALVSSASLSLATVPASRPPRKRGRKYGPDVSHALLSLWRLCGGLCAKRLVPFLPELIEALERFDELSLCPSVKEKLLQMSISTAERILSRARRSLDRGVSTTEPGELLRHQIPIHTFEDWSDLRPGFFEIDLVAHCGGTASGEYVHTLTMTDICTGWVERIALVNRSHLTVIAGIERARQQLPFPLLGIDSDNGAEFINHALKRYCDEQGITFTRCRPYKKNDQCHVEQKNGAEVRPLAGYARYEGEEAAACLNQLYATDRLRLNFFAPSMKLISKTRTGSRVKKVYDTAKTPWQRLQSAELLSEQQTNQLAQFYRTLNPAQLQRRIEQNSAILGRYAMGASAPPPEAAPLAGEGGGDE